MSFHTRILCLCFASAVLACHAQASIRDYYEEPGLNPFKETINQKAGEHIDPFSGQLQLAYTDFVIPGNGGFDIESRRVYNNPQDAHLPYSPYGYGWTMHFGRIVASNTHSDKICNQNLYATSVIDNPSLELPDGSRQLLVLADEHGPELITKQWWSANCDGNNDVIVRSPDGTTYTMDYRSWDSEGLKIYVTRIEDANGNWMSIDYNTNAYGITYMESVTTSDGRSIIYSYANANGDNARLASVTANGKTWAYHHTYTANTVPAFPVLTKVTRPDGLSWDYSYYPSLTNGSAGSLALDTVTYPSGGTISYDYGYAYFNFGAQKATTVVVERQTGGREITPGVTTYTYNPAHQSPSGYDETFMVAPDHKRRFYHIGYTTNANVWEIGTKRYEMVFDLQDNQLEQFEYSYGSMRLSNENFWHGRDTSRIDNTTEVPLLTRVMHWRQGTAVETRHSDFDVYGNPQVIVETTNNSAAANRTHTFTYSNSPGNWILGLPVQQVIEYPNGAPVTQWTITRSYDASGNLLSEDQSGVETAYTYTPEGDVSTVTDANNNVTEYLNYYRGTPQVINRPEGVIEYAVVNDDGTLASSTNGRGLVTYFAWDGMNRLTGIEYPANADVLISYDHESSILTRGDYKETRYFDGFWQSLGMKREDMNSGYYSGVTEERDAVGNVIFESYPNSTEGKQIAFDALKRVTQITYPDQASRTYIYPNGATVVEVDERGNQTEKLFVSHGSMDNAWLYRILAPESIGSIIYRDGLGQVYRVFQGEVEHNGQLFGFARDYTRDARGFLIQEAHEETGITVYGRDNIGNMTSKEIGTSGMVETRTYDGLNRVMTITYSDGTPTATFSYDDNSNLTSVVNSSATRNYLYDDNDNLVGESLAVDGAVYDVAYEMTAQDHLSTVTYPSGRVVDYGTNALGWQTQATPFVSAVTHHPSGALDTVTYENGAVTVQGLDNRLRPGSLITNNGQADIVSLEFSYDPAGNLSGIVDNAGALHARTVGYDGVNRMTSATGPWGTETITYDARSNIQSRSRNGQLQDYYYSHDRLAYRVFSNFYYVISHDARGNMTSDGPNILYYDGANNLASVDSGSDTIDYTHDGANTRVSRASSSESTNVFYSAKGDLLGEYDKAMGFREYVYLNSRLAARVVDETAVIGH